MSSHCNRYPECGCSKTIGTKCNLPADDPRLKEKEVERDEKGYPLLEDGTVDWELTSKEKEAWREKWERREHGSAKVRKKFPTNRIPPKKKRKK